MKNDEGFLDMLDKSTIIRNQYENVIPNVLKQKFKKGSFYCPFFLPVVKIFSDEEVMKVFFISVISRNTIFTYQI
tara:strand:- start:85 stop:309 length:225 start_codon:yes stop_codon:yes gene_type:complete